MQFRFPAKKSLIPILAFGCLAISNAATIYPEKDTYVSKYKPTTNYGKATGLNVDVGPTDTRIAYVTFRWDRFHVFNKAKVRFYTTNPKAVTHMFYKVRSDSWNEYSTNWNNRPGTDYPALASVSANGSVVEFDITNAVLAETDYAITLAIESNGALAQYHSRETATVTKKPELILYSANTYTVNTSSAFLSAISQATSGDLIRVEPGVYNAFYEWQSKSLNVEGTAPGVQIKGSLGGDYNNCGVHVKNIQFIGDGGTGGFEATYWLDSCMFFGNNTPGELVACQDTRMKITNSEFVNALLQVSTADTICIENCKFINTALVINHLKRTQSVLKRCTFIRNSTTFNSVYFMVVDQSGEVNQKLLIDNCYFYPHPRPHIEFPYCNKQGRIIVDSKNNYYSTAPQAFQIATAPVGAYRATVISSNDMYLACPAGDVTTLNNPIIK